MEDRDPIDDLIGETQAENDRHVIARYAFLEQLLDDSRVHWLFESWHARLPLDAVSTGDVDGLFRAVEDGCAFYVPEAIAFVRDTLALPWPWVAIELCFEFQRRTVGNVTGARLQRTVSVGHVAPSVRIVFETRQDESIAQNQARLVDLCCQGLTELEAGLPPKGYWSRQTDHVTRNARWFYRHKLRGESVRQIAREYHAHQTRGRERASGNDDDRATVRAGINETERLLSLSSDCF